MRRTHKYYHIALLYIIYSSLM